MSLFVFNLPPIIGRVICHIASLMFNTHCTHQTAPLLLSGTNNGRAKNLRACTGECDADSQCAYGLKCFQRSHGEPIPGCTGPGSGRDWDYCYNPSGECLLPVYSHISLLIPCHILQWTFGSCNSFTPTTITRSATDVVWR